MIQEATELLRFGYDCHDPMSGYPNADNLLDALDKAVIWTHPTSIVGSLDDVRMLLHCMRIMAQHQSIDTMTMCYMGVPVYASINPDRTGLFQVRRGGETVAEVYSVSEP